MDGGAEILHDNGIKNNSIYSASYRHPHNMTPLL